MHQAAILYGLAKATTDPKISAALLDKVVDLKSQVHELGAPPDAKPLAPDIEPPATTFRLAGSQEGESGHSRPATSAWAECYIETLSPSLSNGRKGQTFAFIKVVLAPSTGLPNDAAKSQGRKVGSTYA